MTLGRPTSGLTSAHLEAENGKGDSLTCFAKHAIFDWHENIPLPSMVSQKERREAICILANNSYLHPLTMMAIILIKKREARVQTSMNKMKVKC